MTLKTAQLLYELLGVSIVINDGKVTKLNFFEKKV